MKRARRFLVRLLAALTAGFILVAAGALWLVSTGPVSLGFLTPYFQDALGGRDSGYRITFADTVLAWGGWERTLDLRVLDVRVLAPDETLIAQAPEISVTLSIRALFDGVLAPTGIDLIGPALRLVRNEDGRIALGAATPRDPIRAGSMLELLLAALGQPATAGTPLAYLTRIGIADGTVWIEDRATGAEWFAPRLDAILERRTAGISAELDLVLALQSGSVGFTATAEWSDVPGVLTMAAAFSNLNPADLVGSAPLLANVGSVNAEVSGNVAALVVRDGSISRIEFDLASGPGVVRSPLWREPIAYDSATMRGTVLDGLRTVRIDDFFVAQSGASAEASGLFTFAPQGLGFVADASWTNVPVDRFAAMWPVTLAPFTRHWVTTNVRTGLVPEGTLHLRAAPGEIPLMPGKGEIDLRFAYTGAAGTYLDGQPELREARGVGRLTNRAFDLTVETGRVGSLTVAEGAVHIDGIDSLVPQMVIELVASGPTAEALRILSLAPLALDVPRDYGGAMAARAQIALPLGDPIPPEQIKYAAAVNLRDLTIPTGTAQLSLTDGALSLRADATGIEAQGTLSANGVPLRIDARVPTRPGQAIQVTASGTLNDDARKRLGIDAGALIQGPVGAIARLEIASAAGGPVGVRRGSFDLDLATARIDLPGEGWDKSVGQAATANLLLEPAPDGVLNFTSLMIHTPQFTADGRFSLDPRSATSSGGATINGYEVAFTWKRTDPGGAGHISATARADEKMLAAFGYALEPWLSGPLQIGAEIDTAGTEPGLVRVALDLRDATIATNLYAKAAGQDGFAELTFAPDTTRAYRLRSFAGTAAGLALAGTVEAAAAPDTGWRRIQFARFVLGETTMSATVEQQAGGALVVAAQGQRLDIRPMFGGVTVADGSADPDRVPLPPLQFSGRFDNLIIGPDRTLHEAAGTGEFRDGAWRSLGATARLPNGASVAVAIADAEGGQNISVTSTDAGSFLAVFGLFQGAGGGAMELNGKIENSGGMVLAGTFVARDFRLVRAPGVLQLLSVASLFGIVESLQGPGIQFLDYVAPFRISANSFTLGDSRARGASLGITIAGTLDRRTDTMDFRGTIVPFFAINDILGRIPLLGDIFIGEGVLATNYRVTGSPASPVITINPVSTLTPGFLRELLPN